MSDDLNPNAKNSIDLAAARAKLGSAGASRMWQSLEELSATPQFEEFRDFEFPPSAGKGNDGIDRRDVLKLMAASAAMAGLSACTKLPTEKIVPYVKPPEEILPGRPLFYATALFQAGVATGVLVESHTGRPTKIEGNSEHPGSLGPSDIFSQAAILQFWDPDRSQSVYLDGRVSTWSDFAAKTGNYRTRLLPKGSGLRILTETITSPTLGAQMKTLLAQYPEAKWHQYEPCGADSVREGARMAFGRPVNTVYHFDQADVIVSLDADFLTCGAGHVRYARDFGERRNLAEGASSNLNRLYVAESMPTATGAVSDHRLPIRSADIDDLARQLAAAAGVAVPPSANASAKIPASWVGAVGRDLAAHKGASIVVAGEQQPPLVHALAHAINASLGNVGKTVVYTESIEASPVNQLESLRELVNDLNAGQVDFLVILGGNPVYDAPADFDFATAMQKAKLRVHSGLYHDETAELCHWHAPAAHSLESWSDGRAFDGTVGIVQPLIAPLYDGHSAHEVVALFTADAGKTGHELVRNFWQSQRPEKDKAFEALWETSLHDGLVSGTALPAISAAPHADFMSLGRTEATSGDPSAIEVVFRPDPSVGDGEFSNNSWLQELPKPITRLTWDNAIMMGPATAQQLGVTTGDYLTLTLAGRRVDAGAYLVPGHA